MSGLMPRGPPDAGANTRRHVPPSYGWDGRREDGTDTSDDIDLNRIGT
jgi:hypothetical protein